MKFNLDLYVYILITAYKKSIKIGEIMIKLSDHFNFGRLLKFALPSIIMMVFSSVYGVVDGFFVSNYAGKTAFAAVNFIIPFTLILGSFGFMFGTGAGALISKTLGEGDNKKANEIFSMIVYISIGVGVFFSVVGLLVLRPVASLLGATGEMLEQCIIYGRILLISLPFYILQYEFQCLFATAEKPSLGLFVTLLAGCSNMVLDALFVAVWKMGAAGAAIATGVCQFLGGVIPIIYFARKNNSLLRLGKCRLDFGVILKTCTNGSSEFLSNVSMSLVSMLYNVQLMKYAGENGIAAYGVLMYVAMIFLAIFIGYSVGTAPVVGYNFGAGNKKELENVFKRSLILIAAGAVLMFISGEVLAVPLSKLFVGYEPDLLDMTERGFYIFSFAFLFAGFSIYASSFFTALNDGLVSAIISVMRTLVFQIAAVLILPVFLKLDGIWISIVVAEVLTLLPTVFFLLTKRKKYGYA